MNLRDTLRETKLRIGPLSASSKYCAFTKGSPPGRQVGDFEKRQVSNIGRGTKFSILPAMKDEFERHRISEIFGRETVYGGGGEIRGGNGGIEDCFR
jgi:hypothetical protein